MRSHSPSQADAMLARARRLLSDHRGRAKKAGAILDYTLADVRHLLASNPLCAYCRAPLSFAASAGQQSALCLLPRPAVLRGIA
ncbi:MAG: hypothetical protein ACYC3I_06320 [Gemmataceae bacterium]